MTKRQFGNSYLCKMLISKTICDTGFVTQACITKLQRTSLCLYTKHKLMKMHVSHQINVHGVKVHAFIEVIHTAF